MIKQINLHQIYRLSFMFSLLLFFSCKPDIKPQENIKVEQLHGKWLMHQGFRSGNRSKLLDNAFFEFLPNSQMRTNIMGDESPPKFKFENGTIQTVNDKYFVTKLTSDTLILNAHLKNFDFKFITVKNESDN